MLNIHEVKNLPQLRHLESWELPPITRPTKWVKTGDTSDWPTSTDVCCWHCCHRFEGPPIPLPVHYDSHRNVFHVVGVFCSFSCAKTYNSTNLRNHDRTAHYITLLKKRATGIITHTKPALPRQTLGMFGGHLTIEAFRAHGTRADEPRVKSFGGLNIKPLDTTQESTVQPQPQGVSRPLPDAIFVQDTSTGTEVKRSKGRPRKKVIESDASIPATILPEQIRLRKNSFLPSQGTLDMFLKDSVT